MITLKETQYTIFYVNESSLGKCLDFVFASLLMCLSFNKLTKDAGKNIK